MSDMNTILQELRENRRDNQALTKELHEKIDAVKSDLDGQISEVKLDMNSVKVKMGMITAAVATFSGGVGAYLKSKLGLD